VCKYFNIPGIAVALASWSELEKDFTTSLFDWSVSSRATACSNVLSFDEIAREKVREEYGVAKLGIAERTRGPRRRKTAMRHHESPRKESGEESAGRGEWMEISNVEVLLLQSWERASLHFIREFPVDLSVLKPCSQRRASSRSPAGGSLESQAGHVIRQGQEHQNNSASPYRLCDAPAIVRPIINTSN